MKPAKILFITWDGPQTSYMEGLFMPIFNQIKKTEDIDFHVLQFTWGDLNRIKTTAAAASKFNISYTAVPVYRKPIAILGSLWTLYKGIRVIKKYVAKHHIDVVMPRSTMPLLMVNKIRNKHFRIIFDADGLPLEERVDFANLSRKSSQYQFLFKQERKMLAEAQAVSTRSKKSIAIHIENASVALDQAKFSVVFNGRDAAIFKPNSITRNQLRNELGFTAQDTVFVYCGSLGPQYGWNQMMAIFNKYLSHSSNAKFLILTGNIAFAKLHLPVNLVDSVVIQSLPFQKVPDYLNVADVAFAIREPKPSMQGVAPIKLGEYMLMGIPTIASAGIGDSEDIISSTPDCFLFQHDKNSSISDAVDFLINLKDVDHIGIRKQGMQYFSLEESAMSYRTAFQKL